MVMMDKGFILSYIKYGDNDAILHCFTEENGFQSFFVKGIYSSKNKKKVYLSPLNELNFIISDTHKRSDIKTITKIEKINVLDDCQDVRLLSIVFFIADFLNNILKTEIKHPKIYEMIETFLHQVKNQNYQAHFSFLVEYLKVQGLAPLYSEAGFLDPEAGCFVEECTHHLFYKEISEHWKKLVTEPDIYNIKLRNTLKEDFLDSVFVYYYCHFPNFKIPKSLEVLKEIFSE